jgi:uncharacterized protein involved in exopolysaccharide biosynthesis
VSPVNPTNPTAPTGGASPVRLWTIEEMSAALRRRWRVIVICFLALATGAVAAVATAPSVYTGKLKILVKRDRADSVVSGAADPAAARDEAELSETELLSQIELLKSDELLSKVAVETGLARQARAADPARSEAQSIEAAAAALREQLDVAPVKRTWLIDVRYESGDRAEARQVLDTLVRLYLEKHLSLERPAGTYQFFADQAARAKEELEGIRARMATFTEQHQVVSASLEKQAVLQKLNEFDALRAQASAALAETEKRLSTVSSELTRTPEQRTSAIRTDTGVVKDITSRILTLEMKRADLLQKFTPEYRGVVDVDTQLREARAALVAAQQSPVREETVSDNPTRLWLDTELARTRADQAAMQARVQALSTFVGQYRAKAQSLELRDGEQQDLERQWKAAEARYLLYAQKQEEARISDELDRTRIANVVVAEAPTVNATAERRPSAAMLPLLLGVSLLLSLALALVVDVVGGSPAPAPTGGRVYEGMAGLEILNRRMAVNSAKLSARLQELHWLTRAAEARWRRPTTPAPAPAADAARWPSPIAGALRVPERKSA